jgi:integrase
MRKHGEISVDWIKAKNTWYYRVQLNGKRPAYSTGVHQHTAAGKMAAIAKAKQLHAALVSEDQHKLAAVVKRPGFAKCGEVVDLFKLHGPEASKTKAASRFAAFVREASGQEDWREVSTHAVLTAEAMRAWIKAKEQAGKSESGTRSDVQAVRQVVAKRRMDIFKDLKLPNLEEFWKVSGGAAPDQSYEPVERSVIRAMDRAARIPLRRSNPRVWACYWLMRKAGLRNSEVEELRWEWVEFKDKNKAELAMIRRDNWKSKNGKYGRVPFKARLMRLIQAALGKESEYVIPRTSKTDAFNLTHYEINEFVRRFIPEGSKGAYNLRKEFGSSIVLRDGIEVAAKLLRDSREVVYNHYYGLLESPKPL